MTRAITLHQPWATLIASGIKTIETRSWAPPPAAIGQRLLIHAGMKVPIVGSKIGEWEVLSRYGDAPARIRQVGGRIEPLPFGAIVASCVVADAVPMVGADGGGSVPENGNYLVVVPDDDGDDQWTGRLLNAHMGQHEWDDVTDQRPYGGFAPGRWAWMLEDVKATTERCPACWGDGYIDGHSIPTDYGTGIEYDATPCPRCSNGEESGPGRSGPVPAKGKQGIWNWEPT